jgi:hypothetical protein
MEFRLEYFDDLMSACAASQRETYDAMHASYELLQKLYESNFIDTPDGQQAGQGLEQFLDAEKAHMEQLEHLQKRLHELRELLFAPIPCPIALPREDD